MSFIDTESLVIGLSALGAFLTILAIGMPLIQRDGLSSRLKSVAARRDELARQQRENLSQSRRTRYQKKKSVDLMKQVLDKLNLQNVIASRELKNRLSQAGYRSQNAAVVFSFARLALPLVLAGLFLLFAGANSDLDLDLGMQLLIAAGLAVVGFYLPGLLVTNTAQKRQKTLMQNFPDALDLLVICVEAGLSIEGAFTRVSEELVDSAPDLAEEFGLTTAELAFLGDRKQAYENLAERTGLPATKSLTTALLQSERYGTPVSVALKVLSQENRDSRMAAAEKKAGALPAQLTVPMIVFFLPVLFIVIIGPAIIQSLENL
ncbi:type II secretion system F family protein [Roseospirillum parvum]|uniref:Tight adherence protein C n=1 Tax=Roseospirillum parvum TaxID=83401 RepID=A0A1G8C0Z4_9PROT|nr:type II secretion system F family protein [Roseospirillum parvum]SDH38993.1 tight adherence protein C [Roseospirillum parvum]